MESSRRNLRGELLTALAALSMLGLAVVFAVVLTADTVPSTPAASPTVQSMAPTQAATDPPQPTATTPATEARSTDAPSETPIVTPSKADPTTVAQAGSSSEPPTATPRTPPTARATVTPRPTGTPTRTPTRTPSPSPTITRTPSATPTATPPPTDTRVYTPTMTSPPARTPTPLPTGTPQPPGTGGCIPPSGWQTYVIRSGDNLFRLALRAGLSTSELQQANCITNAASITTGQVIYVPPSFYAGGTPGGTPVSPGTTSGTPVGSTGGGTSGGTTLYPLRLGCLLPQIRLSGPEAGSSLRGRVTVRGTATLSDLPSFEYYKVELRGVDGVYRHVAQSASPAASPDTILALLDTVGFANGEYQLVLTVVDRTGNFPEPCAIRVYLQN